MEPTLPPQPSSPQNSRLLIRFMGILAGVAISGLIFWAEYFLYQRVPGLGWIALGLPNLVLVPAVGGLIAAYIWRRTNPTIGGTCLYTLAMTLLALFVGWLLFNEGAICLLILSPLYYVSLLGGALVGRLMFRNDPSRLKISVIPLLILAVIGEPLTRSQHRGVVTDEIHIHAAPEKVWPALTSFREIPTPPKFWLFRLGLPYPESTTSAGDFVDADRRCNFSHNAVFKERVAELIPNEKLTFEILESPPDPELVGHLTPHRGQFVLRRNTDGTTTLTGSTWYTLHVRPVWYFDLWTHHIFRAVHLRVMEDIRRRAEARP